MPLSAVGKLSIVASADLGSLGTRTGSAVSYDWEMPNPAPQFLPWLVILGLLALKPNRAGAAWLIWAALIAGELFTTLLPGVPADADFLLSSAQAISFGLAAVWLLLPYLRCRHRVTTTLFVLFAVEGFSLMTAVIWDIADSSNANSMVVVLTQQALVLGIGGLVTAGGLMIAGWLCRRQFRVQRIYFAVLAGVVAGWLGISLPFFLVAIFTSGDQLVWSEFLLPVMGVAGVHFALLLPFLILSSANGFYRDRLKLLFHIQPPAPPTVAASAEAPAPLKA